MITELHDRRIPIGTGAAVRFENYGERSRY